ncbi:hypothetical protein [Actinoplanes friuliensis]|uniref:Putative lipoprotein n=1 Tax=Actinoplanes friuliensis DSM 7358 TaxID=1246995 RepID=U5W9Y6_9ACTN|nr:hypothetical protein [Actinoplanes friuliensis]AGZ45832.1 Putative lipoprotein [Actinoplanes friuliensis DSM 7358]
MRNRRLAIAGLALMTALGLAGCGPADKVQPRAGASADVPEAAPKAELAAAAKRLGEQSMRVDMDMAGAISMSGVADPAAGTAKMAMDLGLLGQDTKIEFRKLGDDVYLKFGGQMSSLLGTESSKPWMHVDATELAKGSSLTIMSKDDPGNTKALIEAMTKVEKVGAHDFKGTLDLSKSPQYNKESLKALGGKMTDVPFTATTDDQDRLTGLTLDMSSLGQGTGKIKTTYTDFGTPVSVEAPPAKQVGELPKEFAGLLDN